MKGEWEILSLANAPLEIIDGDRGVNYPKQEDFASFGYCLFLNTGNVTTTGFNFADCSFISKEKDTLLRKGKLQRNDIVLTTRGTVGNVALFNESVPFNHVRINSGMVLLRANQALLLPKFLYQFVRSPLFRQQVAALSTGSAQPQLPIRDIRRVEISLPPLPEQEKIACILGTLDDKIELNRRMNATLEAMARALFKSWFVDFDPVRAKLDGRKPAGMDDETAALFPSEFEESSLGPIPKGWRVHPLTEVIQVNPRRTLKNGSIAPYLDMKNMPTQGHAPDEVIDREFSSGTKFQNGDTLLARITPCLENGKTAFVDFLEEGQVGWGSTEYIIFSPIEPLPAEFGYFLARSESLRQHAIQNMVGTSGRQRVPADCFSQFWLTVPSPEVGIKFGSIVGAWIRKIKANIQQVRTLEKVRNLLLPKLLSGEIKPKFD